MASGSPTIHSRIKAARSPMVHSRHFAEDSSRTRIELSRNNLRMEKELKKIEKQAKTAALNLSNNQQAIRMSLRQLESKRNSDSSPLLTSSARFDKNESTGSKHKLSLFANNTSLSVASTADAYRNGATAFPGGRARSRSTSGHQLENSERSSAENGADVDVEMIRTRDSEAVFDPDATALQVNTDHRSPYISTPLNVRRVVRTKLSKPFHSLSTSQHLPATAQHHKQVSPLSQSFHSIRNIDKSHNSGSDLKLPPVLPFRTVISAHHNTTDKATLKRASELLGMSGVIDSTKSDGPTSFQQFYGSNLIVVSPSETPCCERDDIELSYSDDEGPAATNDPVPAGVGSSTSLSEQFEQIKKCRYIRHYNPNGEKPQQAWH